MKTWPFPPPGGPVPWTAAQVKRYARERREALPPAPMVQGVTA
jgi:hypothetical protein